MVFAVTYFGFAVLASSGYNFEVGVVGAGSSGAGRNRSVWLYCTQGLPGLEQKVEGWWLAVLTYYSLTSVPAVVPPFQTFKLVS